MYCNQCGAQVPDGAVFCPKCGAAQNKGITQDNIMPQNNGMPQAPGTVGSVGTGENLPAPKKKKIQSGQSSVLRRQSLP